MTGLVYSEWTSLAVEVSVSLAADRSIHEWTR
jgi:hypothetical protein